MNMLIVANKYKLPLRIAFALLVPITLLGGALYLHHFGNNIFRCVFYQVTGLYCPGCGSGRAATDLVHGNVLRAIEHNVFFVIFLPILTYYGLKRYLAFVLSKDVLPFLNISYRGSVIVLWIILIYTILRNIPIMPFKWLAP